MIPEVSKTTAQVAISPTPKEMKESKGLLPLEIVEGELIHIGNVEEILNEADAETCRKALSERLKKMTGREVETLSCSQYLVCDSSIYWIGKARFGSEVKFYMKPIQADGTVSPAGDYDLIPGYLPA